MFVLLPAVAHRVPAYLRCFFVIWYVVYSAKAACPHFVLQFHRMQRKMIQAATAAMNMEGMLEASGKPLEFRKLDEEGKKVLNKKNPVPGPHHPTYLTMIKGAVLALNEGKGASKPAILKYLAQHYQLGENLPKINSHLCSALKRGTKGGDIEQRISSRELMEVLHRRYFLKKFPCDMYLFG
ncbi:linker histone H1 and H5 family protein [Ancylostoma duodenale]|uniref:Linker histone H1 and H5 family protein n=1 Tax=Ancylostoma duodenale TaxID=51022 RepID=A0A0C2HB79_9BILA|nr:linker histone H1 and H5 family protein [Ancylostoma duodenale]